MIKISLLCQFKLVYPGKEVFNYKGPSNYARNCVCMKTRAHTHSLKMNPCRGLSFPVWERPVLIISSWFIPYHQWISSCARDVHVYICSCCLL